MAQRPHRLSLENLESRINLSASPAFINAPVQDSVSWGAIAHARSQAAYVSQNHSITPITVELSAAKPGTTSTTNAAAGLTAPNTLTATASGTSITLKWKDRSTNELGFHIYRSSDGGKTFAKIATIGANATSYVDTTVLPDVGYKYKIAAYNSTMTSSFTQAISASLSRPTAPATLAYTNVTTTSISLAWSDSASNETGYHVRRSSDGVNFTTIANLGANATTFTDTNLTENTVYYYEIGAWNTAGQTFSNTLGAETLSNPINSISPTAPNAPSSLSFSNITGTSVTFNWNDNSANEDGYRIYRSTDNVNYTLVGTLAANSTSFNNTNLTQGTTYYFLIGAFNNYGQTPAGPASVTTTAAPLPPPTNPNPVTIRNHSMTTFTQLEIDGTSGADSILITQSGGVLTILANGDTTTLNNTYGNIVIHGFGGNDSITVDSTINIATLLYGGEGADTLTNRTSGKATIVDIDNSANVVTGNGINTGYWVNPGDVVNSTAAEIALGGVNRIASFYQTSVGAVPRNLYGQNLADPTDSTSVYRTTNNSFFGIGATMNDINQGTIGDCYYLSSLASLANNENAKFMNTGVDLGDGTYAVRFVRGGVTTFVRVDGDLSTNYFAHAGASGNIWGALYEKAYAFFRTGASTYASLNWGNQGNALSDLGFANSSMPSGSGDTLILNTINSALNSDRAVAANTRTSITGGTPVIASHVYSVIGAYRDAGGTVQIQMRNPWGFDGAGSDANVNDGIVTISYSAFAANFYSLTYTTV